MVVAGSVGVKKTARIVYLTLFAAASPVVLSACQSDPDIDITKLTVVPFRSSADSMSALLGGHVDVVSATGVVPTGKVKFYLGKKLVKSVKLKSGQTTVKVKYPAVEKKGTYKVTVTKS